MPTLGSVDGSDAGIRSGSAAAQFCPAIEIIDCVDDPPTELSEDGARAVASVLLERAG